MSKSVFFLAAVQSVIAPLAVSAASVPLLSGSYVYTSHKLCQMNVVVTYGTSSAISGSPFVKSVTSGAGWNGVALAAGVLKFVQSAAGSGTVTINGFQADGSAILLTETGRGIGSGGTDGAPLQIQTKSGSASFSQTATMLSVKDTSGGVRIPITSITAGSRVASSKTRSSPGPIRTVLRAVYDYAQLTVDPRTIARR